MDLYINDDLADNMVHVDGTTWTSSELVWEVESILGSFGENAAAGQPAIRFAGFTSQPWNAQLGTNTIHLTVRLGGPDVDCNDHGTASAPGSYTNGAWIVLKRSGTGVENGEDLGLEDCGKRWEQYITSGAPPTPNHNLRSTLNHEIMHHFMGPNHYGDCGYVGQCASAVCACADGNESPAERWSCYRFDWEAMRVHHGRFANGQYEHDESLDGLSWFSATPGSGGALEFAPLPGLSDTNLTYMFAAVRRPYLLYGRLWRWVYTTQAWEYWGYLGNTNDALLGSVDVAYGGSPAYPHFAWLYGETFTEGDKAIVVTRFTGPNQRTHYQWGSQVTWAQGISITYDPKNDWYYVLWRDNDLFVQIQVFDNGTFSYPATLMDGGNAIRAAETPSMACGPGTLDKNCLLVWASIPEGTEEYHSLRWVQFDVTVVWGLSFWDWGPYMNQGYPQYGAPSVSYQGPTSSDEAYLVSWKVPWSTVYTMGKDVNASSFWDGSTIRSHTVPGDALSPALGGGSGVNELITVWR